MQAGRVVISSSYRCASLRVGRVRLGRRVSTAMVDFDAENTRLYLGIAECHRHERGPWSRIVGEIKGLGVRPGARVLDLASGQGEPASTMALAMPGVRVTSADVSPDMGALAAKQAEKISNLDSVIVDMMDQSVFPDSTFDAVTACYGFMFPSDKDKAMRETFRVLKPGGVLVSTHWEEMTWMKISKEMLTRLMGTAPPPPPINPLSLAEADAFRKLAEGAGFEFVREERSTYPFSFGKDKVEQYKMATLTVRPLIEENGGMDKAMPLWHQLVDEMGVGTRDEAGELVIDGNRFCMVVLKKPGSA